MGNIPAVHQEAESDHLIGRRDSFRVVVWGVENDRDRLPVTHLQLGRNRRKTTGHLRLAYRVTVYG